MYNKSIQSRLMVNFFLVTIIPIIIIGGASYYISTTALNNKLNMATLSALEQVNKNVENEISKINKYMDIIFTNATIQNILRETDFSGKDFTVTSAFVNLDTALASIFYGDKSLVSALILKQPNGKYTYKGNAFIDELEWRNSLQFKEALLKDGRICWFGTEKNKDSIGGDEYVISVGRVIKDTAYKKDMVSLGIAYLVFDEKMFSNIYQQVDVDQFESTMILDSDGGVISHWDKNMLGRNISDISYIGKVLSDEKGWFIESINGVKMAVAYYTSNLYGWKTIKLIPYSYFNADINNIRNMTIILGIVCLVILNIVSYISANSIVRAIQKISNTMKYIADGNFDISVNTGTRDEIGQMAESFNTMVKRVKELFEKTVIQEKKNREIEIKALQYQINPHFLYNTLGSIRMVAMLRGFNEISDMLQALIRLLRNTIGKTGNMITVAEEIENLKNYIYIQNYRYKGILKAYYDISGDIMDYKLPNLLLQPLVENAIFHGIDQHEGKGVIRISGFRDSDRLVFAVEDNGVGMSEKQIEEILSGINEQQKGSFSRIGIKNIDDRIKLNFGDVYGICIRSGLNCGTVITVTLPIVEGDLNV